VKQVERFAQVALIKSHSLDQLELQKLLLLNVPQQ
jgi:hypothetical protein